MLSKRDFITMSLDLNLFFLRIMKEHSFFLEIAFTPANSQMAAEAKNFKMKFEKLLLDAINLADCNVSEEALNSNQFVTEFTFDAERLTSCYTGSPFKTNLTKKELMLSPVGRHATVSESEVRNLNHRSCQLTMALADFKERLLNNVLNCKVFTMNYPLLIEHILREAKFFILMLNSLNEKRDCAESVNLINQEVFWNRQMAEHAKFIAGLLDPSEEALIGSARMFGNEFDMLTAESKQASKKENGVSNATKESIMATKRLRDFKTAGTEGLLDCNIKSIIVPLLADHVLREANHYLFVLGECDVDRE